MTKQDILDYFKDIDAMYNDCTKYDTLKRMLDELQEPCGDAIRMDRIIQTNNADYEGCMLVNNCNYKTAACYVCKPDDGCYPYRYIKKIIEKENAKMEDKKNE